MNEITEYISMTEAGKAIRISKTIVNLALINHTNIKKTYFIKYLIDN